MLNLFEEEYERLVCSSQKCLERLIKAKKVAEAMKNLISEDIKDRFPEALSEVETALNYRYPLLTKKQVISEVCLNVERKLKKTARSIFGADVRLFFEVVWNDVEPDSKLVERAIEDAELPEIKALIPLLWKMRTKFSERINGEEGYYSRYSRDPISIYTVRSSLPVQSSSDNAQKDTGKPL